MPLPTNKIKKIKLPNDTEYDIVPTMLQDGTTNNKLSVPTLSGDDTILTSSTNQTVGGRKTFSNELTANGNIRTDDSELYFKVYDEIDSKSDTDGLCITVNYDDNSNNIGTSVMTTGHFTAYGDNDDANTNKPTDETSSEDLDTDYFNTGITLRGDDTYKLSFPAKSGVFATTEDCQIPIEDLTQINNN